MKAATIRLLASERCSAEEIAVFLGMDPCRVRWLLRRGGHWPRRDSEHEKNERRMTRLVARMAA